MQGAPAPADDVGAPAWAPSPCQLPASSLVAAHSPPLATDPRALKRVKTEYGGDYAEASPDARELAQVQAVELRSVLGASSAAGDAPPGVSFLQLCSGPPGGANAAAKRFFNLLELHMEGAVRLSQDEPYGDIGVSRGPAWPANWTAAA